MQPVCAIHPFESDTKPMSDDILTEDYAHHFKPKTIEDEKMKTIAERIKEANHRMRHYWGEHPDEPSNN